MTRLHKKSDMRLVSIKLNKNVIEVLDQLIQSGLFKSRVDVILSALRNYEFFTTKWKNMKVNNSNINLEN